MKSKNTLKIICLDFDGVVVGSSDGDNVGESVGDIDGDFVGSSVGDNVGENVLEFEYDDEWIHTYSRFFNSVKRELTNMIEE